MTIQAPSNITFLGNRAFRAGLIIALAFYNACPLQFFTSEKQDSITLNVHNSGYYIGNCFIYSDALTKCNKTYFTKYIHQSGNLPLLSSPPTALCLCGENMTCLSSFPSKLSFYPGQKFLSLFASDFEHKPVSTKVYVDLHHRTGQHVDQNVATSTSQLYWMKTNALRLIHIFLKIPLLLD